MDTSVETITPEQASKYLMRNTSNRQLRTSLVSKYTKDMEAGNWCLSHQGIAFNCDGTLLDGQHRLKAVLQSGVTVKMLVARNVDSKSQLVMDDHARRSASDSLSLVLNEKITKTSVAIIRAAVDFMDGQRNYLTNQQISDLIDPFRPALDFAESKLPSNDRGIGSAPVRAAVALAWFYVKDIKRLEEFCDILAGRSLPVGNGDGAATKMRETLLGISARGEEDRAERFRKCQRAIALFCERKSVSKLYGTEAIYRWPLVNPTRS